MTDTGLNIKTMEEEILNNPEVYQTTFIVSCTDNCSNFMNCFQQFIGKDKIKGLQMRENMMLVTMNNVDDMNDLLASVTLLGYSSGRCYRPFAFIPVLPVPARVRIKISDIPLPLASANLMDIKELFREVAKELKDVVLSLERVDDIQTGNVIVDALTDDLKMTHGKLKSNTGITYKIFHGTVTFMESFPVREESRGKFKPNDDITIVEPWK